MFGRRDRIYHSLVRFNAVVRHLGMNSERIVVDTFCYVENNYGLKVENAYFGMDLLSDLRPYEIPVCQKGLSRFGKYRPKYFRRFTFSLKDITTKLK